MNCTELIIEDHAILRRGLQMLDLMVRTMEDGGRIEIADAMAIARFLRLFGDEYHQTSWDEVLGAALPGDALQEEQRRIRSERAEIRTLVSGLEKALAGRKPLDFVRLARRLNPMLKDHCDREAEVLCDIARRTISAEAEAAVVAGLTANPVRRESRSSLVVLERKYAARMPRNPLPAAGPAQSGSPMYR
jgi:hemerythrin-like domain-containing protein